MPTATVVSVQVGSVQVLGRPGAADLMDRPWTSGVHKRAVSGRVRVRRDGLEGDAQADLVNHGGADKAVLAYSLANLGSWEPLLGPVAPGGFGENLTIDGLDETTVCIGDRVRVGSVRLECSQPRQPCWKLGRRWRRADLPQRVVDTGFTGWYFRVLDEGDVGASDPVELLARPHPDWPVIRAARLMQRLGDDPLGASELAAVSALSASWRQTLLARQ